jgi:PST family polysaccharide transporter
LLYSAEFGPSVALLQWQAFGNVFKLASWALSFSIVAAARGKTFLWIELSFNVIFLGMVILFLPHIGLAVTAYAFVLAYLAYLTIVYFVCRRIHCFRFEALSLQLLAVHTALPVSLLVLAQFDANLTGFVSLVLALVTGIYGLRIVLMKIGPKGQIASRITRLFTAVGWPIPETQ